MFSMSFKYNIVPKFQSCEDIQNELKRVNGLRAKHESLCRSFSRWRTHAAQNDSQLDILNSTASSLQGRHKVLTDALASRHFLADSAALKRLQREINAIETQLFVWIRELTEVSDDRVKLRINHALEDLKLRANLQRSMTNIELAHIDVDFLQDMHCRTWKKFLEKKEEDKQEEHEESKECH